MSTELDIITLKNGDSINVECLVGQGLLIKCMDDRLTIFAKHGKYWADYKVTDNGIEITQLKMFDDKKGWKKVKK